MTKVHKHSRWLNLVIKAYWAVLSILVVASITQAVSYRSATFAEAQTDTTTALPFNEYFCNALVGPAEGVILALAALMILGAGVLYMISMGQTGGDSGISTAKSMMTAAVTGIALYSLSSVLLGNCGFQLGGFIGSFFNNDNQPAVESGSPTSGSTGGGSGGGQGGGGGGGF